VSAVRLHLLRHADAGDPLAWHGPDADRPLSDKGRRQAERLGRLLAGMGFETDALVSSPKIRAVQTAEGVAEALGIEVRIDDRLSGGLDADAVVALGADAGGPRRPVLVGHDPDFSWLLSALVGAEIGMKKGAMARVDVDGELTEGGGTLRWLITPELLPGGLTPRRAAAEQAAKPAGLSPRNR
jgi:phosphohistidine phosphatase